jgi:hypothetical protein
MTHRWSITIIAAIALLAAPARADDTGFVGTYRLGGREGTRALQGTLVIRPQGEGYVLSGPLGSRGQVELEGAIIDDTLTFAPPEPTVGIAGALGGETAAAASSYTVRLTSTGAGKLRGEVKDDTGRARMRLELTRKKRTLIAHATGYEASHDATFLTYGRLVKSYYSALGHQVVMLPAPSWDTLLAELVRAGDAGEPYARVVTIGHGGWDGPMLGGQISPWSDDERWASLVDALRRGTVPEAKMYASACHAGGSNRWEDHRPADRWVERLARETRRTVAGPAGVTSTTLVLRQVRALEGVGTTAQETRIASATGVRILGAGGSASGGRRLTWEQVDAASTSAP